MVVSLRGLVNQPSQVFEESLKSDPSSGDDRDRTDNLRLARAALSQLSYVPECRTGQTSVWRAAVGLNGCTWTRTTDLGFIRAAL